MYINMYLCDWVHDSQSQPIHVRRVRMFPVQEFRHEHGRVHVCGIISLVATPRFTWSRHVVCVWLTLTQGTEVTTSVSRLSVFLFIFVRWGWNKDSQNCVVRLCGYFYGTVIQPSFTSRSAIGIGRFGLLGSPPIFICPQRGLNGEMHRGPLSAFRSMGLAKQTRRILLGNFHPKLGDGSILQKSVTLQWMPSIVHSLLFLPVSF